MRAIILLFFVQILLSSFSYGGKIDRAFEALKIYNYFKAKELFQKAENTKPSIAKYGLSIIYFRNDNPFHNLDSAYSKIVISEKLYISIKERLKDKYCAYNFDYNTIIEMRNKVSHALYKRAVSHNTENSLVQFLNKNPWTLDYHNAVLKRDSLAFITAQNGDKSSDYELFLKKYPKSTLSNQAKALYFDRQYHEETQSKTLNSYLSFVQKHPKNPYNSTAQDRIFEIVCAPNTVEAYDVFVHQYPKNKNSSKAWRLLYRRYLVEFSVKRIEAFEKDFPDYPFKNELLVDKKLVNQLFLPYNLGEKWGYINQAGEFVIKPKFDGAGYFNNGTAIVSLNDKLGYINKRGEYIVQAQFEEANPFHNGVASFEKNEKYGLINQTGVIIFKPTFEDIGKANENLFFAKKDSLYACYTINGELRIPPCYTNATEFKNHHAIVAQQTGWGLIDTLGAAVLPFSFNKLQAVSHNYLAETGDSIFIFSNKGDTLLFEDSIKISAFSEGFALIFKDDKIAIINENGQMISDFIFDYYPNAETFGLFKNGHAKMYDKSKERYGLIDTTGKWTVLPRYKDISFYGKIIAAKRYRYWEYFTPEMNRKWSIKFAIAESFIGSSAVVIDENKYGLFGLDGAFLLPAKYDEIIEIHPKIFRLRDSLGYTISNKFGEILLKEHYNRLDLVLKNIIRMNKNGKLSYYLINENRLITIKDDKL